MIEAATSQNGEIQNPSTASISTGENMKRLETQDSDVEEKEQLFQNSILSSKTETLPGDIPLVAQHVNDSDYVPQKKIGPIGRKRFQNKRVGASHLYPQRKSAAQDASSKRGKKGRKGGSEDESSFKSILTRSLSWGDSRAKITDVDHLDENGLASLHIAAQNNDVAKIHELIQREADVNVQSYEDEATPLHIAARYNCPDAAEVLLQYGADVTDPLSNGQTPLHVCCRRGYLKIVKILICDGKADTNSRDKDRTTPLHQATIHGNVDVCTFLIDKGAQIRAKDVHRLTPLMLAADNGFEECVRLILTKATKSIPAVDLLSDKDNEGNTALHLAVGNRHINVARFLVKHGAPLDCKKKTNGFTPLHQAAIIGEETLVQMLIGKGADTGVVDGEQMTALHRATMYNRVDIVLLLIKQGLPLESKDEDNFTPLLCAAWQDQTEAGLALLRHGADIKAVDKEMKTCLHWAAEMQNVEFVKMLFEEGHGGDKIVNWKDRAEQTPLHYAAEVGNVEIIKMLIENGATVDMKDGEEKAPLHIASRSGHYDGVKTLLDASMITLNDSDIDDMTPLLLASENGHHRVVKYLVKMGADITSRNSYRRSALALAANNNELQVMNVLMDNNADVNAMDKDRNTALHLCSQFGHEAPAKLLLKNGANVCLPNVYGKYALDVAIENKREKVAVAILSSNSWEAAMDNVDATGHSPMPRLIAKLPEAALLVMNQCVTYSHQDRNHPDLKITYDYRYIDPGPDDISYVKSRKRYIAMETMVEFKREKLLSHRLSQRVLKKKWNSFARYFNYWIFLFYLTFVFLVSWSLKRHMVIYNTHDKDENGCAITNLTGLDTDAIKEFFPDYDDYYSWDFNSAELFYVYEYDPLAIRIQKLIILFTLFYAIVEIVKLVIYRLTYFKSIEPYLHWCQIISNFLFALPVGTGGPRWSGPCSLNWRFGAIAVFLTWANFIMILNRFDFFGLYVSMFFTTLKSLLKAMTVYVFFVIGFAMAFFVCFQATHETFRNEFKSSLTTFVMMLGEINKGDLFDSGIDIYPFEEVADVLIVIFLFVMPMVLNNLTIGIAVGDIEQILDSSYYKRLSLQVDLVLSIERGFPRWLQRKLWISKFEHCPNKRWKLKVKTGSLFGKRSNKFLQKSKEETEREITVVDVLKEVKRNESSISTLSTIIQLQGKLLRRIAEKHDIKVDAEDLAALTSVSQDNFGNNPEI